MKQSLIKQLFQSMKDGQERLHALNPKQKSQLEKSWDVEHAYYSSTLEGSKLDKKEFEELAKAVQ